MHSVALNLKDTRVVWDDLVPMLGAAVLIIVIALKCSLIRWWHPGV